MVIKLLPENITKNWPTIKFAIEQALPPTVGEGIDKMNRILESLLAGDLECWVNYEVNDDQAKVLSIGTTKVIHDSACNTNTLLIYSVYNFHVMNDKQWLESFMTLRKYAKSRDCVRVTSYTDNPRMLELAKKFGGETKYTFCSFPTNPL